MQESAFHPERIRFFAFHSIGETSGPKTAISLYRVFGEFFFVNPEWWMGDAARGHHFLPPNTELSPLI